MNNISIKNVCNNVNLDRKISLSNGAIVVHKENDCVVGIYLVVSFRDNRNRYEGDPTNTYCTLINLDNGRFAFEERCSRATTERRVLRHLTQTGYTKPYNPDSRNQDHKFQNMRIQVYTNGNYKVELELGNEYVGNIS